MLEELSEEALLWLELSEEKQQELEREELERQDELSEDLHWLELIEEDSLEAEGHEEREEELKLADDGLDDGLDDEALMEDSEKLLNIFVSPPPVLAACVSSKNPPGIPGNPPKQYPDHIPGAACQ